MGPSGHLGRKSFKPAYVRLSLWAYSCCTIRSLNTYLLQREICNSPRPFFVCKARMHFRTPGLRFDILLRTCFQTSSYSSIEKPSQAMELHKLIQRVVHEASDCEKTTFVYEKIIQTRTFLEPKRANNLPTNATDLLT